MNLFNEVIGHDHIISHMKNAYSMGKVSHAYILEGEEGMGKKLLTNCFVKLLQLGLSTTLKRCFSAFR